MCYSGPQIYGSGALGGAQAELLAVPAADFQLLAIPEGISTEQALLLTDNLATGWAAAQRADIPVGGTVAVRRAGAVGQCAAAQRVRPRRGHGVRRRRGRRSA
ncbi:putative zinc-binding alcohol dehydrogenase [Mycobacterium talmoniae]|uniref:Putative zinc-binding alcohol dehydrogenase n=1 Tax=Mycobacterium talmoniae TaxID=1858794 RepID=A0A2S8BNZ2_9MYCO|nr:putative zinc-binding alcohol dehydrogenase [Mycobacterium talmoniae]